MFLNKKSLTKIWLLVGAYLALATFSFLIAIVFAILEIEGNFHIIVGCFCLAVAPLTYAIGRYAEGKGKLINSANKLIFHQLRPADFIRLYEEKRDDSSNVISKPDFDVLQALIAAYDALGDADRALETADQILAITPKKKLARAKLLKCSLLYSIGRSEEAEVIYRDVLNGKLDMMTKYFSDVVMKSDRALALGDDTTAEAYSRQVLSQKSTPLSILYAHCHLAEVCYRTNRRSEAEVHLNYCIENGGETGIQRKAATKEIFI